MGRCKTITLLQQKGGSGKTTSAMNLAGGLRELGHTVIVADMDKDKPDAWSWAEKKPNGNNFVQQVDEKQARDQISKLKETCDFLIIDTPPNFQTAALKASLLADLVVIPAAPSGMDLSGLLEAKDLALTAGRPFKLLANRIVKNTTMSRSLLGVIKDEGQSFNAAIPQSVKFVEAEAAGLYIGEYANESNAHIEVRKLAKEVVEFFNHNEL
jgi:chromosome partitioning protein